MLVVMAFGSIDCDATGHKSDQLFASAIRWKQDSLQQYPGLKEKFNEIDECLLRQRARDNIRGSRDQYVRDLLNLNE